MDVSTQTARQRKQAERKFRRELEREARKEAQRLAEKEWAKYGYSRAEERAAIARLGGDYKRAEREVRRTPTLTKQLALLSQQEKSAKAAAIANFELYLRVSRSQLAGHLQTWAMGAGWGGFAAGLSTSGSALVGVYVSLTLGAGALTYFRREVGVRIKREYGVRRKGVILRAWQDQQALGAGAKRRRR